LLLRGVVLAPAGPIDPGELLIVDDTIACVAADCSGHAAAAGATIVETHGVISPGLIDAHNHLPYNFLPEWTSSRLWTNRYTWAEDPSYEDHVRPYAAHRSTGTHYCPAAKWGELRSIVHGTTTIQGQSFEQGCIDRLARNADSFHGLGPDRMQTTIESIRDVPDDASSGTDRSGLIANFESDATTRFAVHMAEGYEGSNVESEFTSIAGRDARPGRMLSLLYDADGAPFRTAVLIHVLGLSSEEIDEAASAGAYAVWSPSSNMVLYGRTADIAHLLASGMPIALGPDWTISGEDEMLSEMRFAYRYAQSSAISGLDPRRLWQMATEGGALAAGLEAFIGKLEVGMRADVAVFGRRGDDPYRAVLDSVAADVRLVAIDGLVYFGDLALESLALNGSCDTLDACGAEKFLCAAGTPGASSRQDETVEQIHQQLYDILEGTGYPEDEQYGRGDELLELVDCAAD
jgi:5-methylthioadenosine/S-adenosylhomocysteine deaminase